MSFSMKYFGDALDRSSATARTEASSAPLSIRSKSTVAAASWPVTSLQISVTVE
jgi:hypothetical protein